MDHVVTALRLSQGEMYENKQVGRVGDVDGGFGDWLPEYG
jgi:hypothetical protein